MQRLIFAVRVTETAVQKEIIFQRIPFK